MTGTADAGGHRPEEELWRASRRLNSLALALVLALTCGLGMFAATLWLVLDGGTVGADGEAVVGPHLELLSQFFPGYAVSLPGSFVGLLWGLVVGALVGFTVSWLYGFVAVPAGER